MQFLGDIEKYSDLVERVYEASMAPDGWQGLLDELHEATGGARIFLFGYDQRTRTELGQISAGFDDHLIDQFSQHYVHINPYTEGWLSGGIGTVFSCDEACPRAELLASEYYADFLRPQEDIIAGGGITLFRDEERFVGWGAHVRARDAERVEPDLLRMLGLFAPHIARAFDIRRAIGGQAIEALARDPGAGAEAPEVLVVGSRGRLLYASAPALARIEAGDAVRIDGRGNLSFRDARADAMRTAVLAAFGGDRAPAAARTIWLRGRGRPGILCRMVSLRADAAVAAALGAVCAEAEPCLMITLEPRAPSPERVDRLRHLYGFTAAEAEVAVALADGSSLAEIARERNVSVNTVRNQLSALRAKCHAARQVDVVRIVEAER